MSSETALTLTNKRAAWKLSKTHPNPHTRAQFVELRRPARSLLHQDYDEYVNAIADEIHSNPRRFWTLINSRRKCSRIPISVKFKSNSFSRDDRPGAFNTYFSSNFSPPNSSPPPTIESVCSHTLSSALTTPDEVSHFLTLLPANKTTWPL